MHVSKQKEAINVFNDEVGVCTLKQQHRERAHVVLFHYGPSRTELYTQSRILLCFWALLCNCILYILLRLFVCSVSVYYAHLVFVFNFFLNNQTLSFCSEFLTV